MCVISELLATNPGTVERRGYPNGYSFTLKNHVALIESGAIATEVLADHPKAVPVTIRLAFSEDFLNLELVASQSSGEQKQYVVESETVTLLLMDVAYLRNLLQTGEMEQRIALYDRLLKGTVQALQDVSESASWLGSCPALEKTEWALSRIKDSGENMGAISNTRLASHIGVNVVTVGRVLKQLRK